jgi:hypothetical protein
MNHLEEGTMLAIRDRELIPGDARAHLAECGRCRTTLEELERRAEMIASALCTLDGPLVVERAKAAVRARLDARWDADRVPAGRWRAHIGRAAAVLLLAAGAAYALPGSPVRAWLEGSVEGDGATAVGPTSQEAVGEGAIEVDLDAGRIQVVLSGLPPGSTLDVVWTDRATARIVAAAGSSFSFGEGRAEAVVPPGPVRVELPRGASAVSVEVDGRMYLRRAADGLEILVPAAEHTAERIRFIAPER